MEVSEVSESAPQTLELKKQLMMLVVRGLVGEPKPDQLKQHLAREALPRHLLVSERASPQRVWLRFAEHVEPI
jgi:hypothetical protein